MRNPVIKLLKVGAKYKVVCLGDNNTWGQRRAMLVLPGQPRTHMALTQALNFAHSWDIGRIVRYAEQFEGSYASEGTRDAMVDVEPVTVTPAPTAPTSYADRHIEELSKVADLIAARRQALKTIAIIDQQLLKAVGPEMALVIKEGMGRPINGPSKV